MQRVFFRPTTSTLVRTAAIIAAACLVIALFAAIASSRLPMQAAEVFGRLVQSIRNNPGATAVLSLSAVAAAWLTIAIGIAFQEWTTAKHPEKLAGCPPMEGSIARKTQI